MQKVLIGTLSVVNLCFLVYCGILTLHLQEKFQPRFKQDDIYVLNCGMGGLIQLFALYRMLVYEYVDNGNLEQWLHGDVGPCSPLTWDIRMNVVLGTAKGYINF